MAESSSKPLIVVGSEHAGFRAKETIKRYLEGARYRVDVTSETDRLRENQS